jgi:hypothetical protein
MECAGLTALLDLFLRDSNRTAVATTTFDKSGVKPPPSEGLS